MNTTPTTPTSAQTRPHSHPTLTDINGLRFSGVFPQGREPSIRTLREWTRARRIPHRRVGHFVYYDVDEIALFIRTKLFVPARG